MQTEETSSINSSQDNVLYLEFSNLLQLETYQKDIEPKGVSYLAMLDCKTLVKQVIVESMSDSSISFHDNLLDVLFSDKCPVSNLLKSSVQSEKMEVSRTLTRWYGSLSDIIIDEINIKNGLPELKEKIKETNSETLKTFLSIIADSPNYQELVQAINMDKKINHDLLDNITFDERDMQRYLLSRFQTLFQKREWMN